VGTLHPGEARDILESAGRGHLAAPGDLQTLRGHLLHLYEKDRRKAAASPSPAQVPAIYHRRHQAGQLAHLLNRLT
ncbi:MAG: hypothetical protein R6U70_11275, partial [Bacillota bacterium]